MGLGHALRRARERDPRLPRRADLQRADPAPPLGRGRRASSARRPTTTSGRPTACSPRRRSPAATSRRSCWPASSIGTPTLLLVGQPTRGVDIGAIEFIHRRLVALRDAGKALLLVSVELDEILALADRILVMHDGRVVGDVPRADATERTLGLMMAGVAATST